MNILRSILLTRIDILIEATTMDRDPDLRWLDGALGMNGLVDWALGTRLAEELLTATLPRYELKRWEDEIQDARQVGTLESWVELVVPQDGAIGLLLPDDSTPQARVSLLGTLRGGPTPVWIEVPAAPAKWKPVRAGRDAWHCTMVEQRCAELTCAGPCEMVVVVGSVPGQRRCLCAPHGK